MNIYDHFHVSHVSRPYHRLWLHLPSNTSWIFTVMMFKVNQIRSIGKGFKYISLRVTGDVRILFVHVYCIYFWLVKFILFYLLFLMRFIPLCLYYVSKCFDAIWIFLHKLFQFAILPVRIRLNRAHFLLLGFLIRILIFIEICLNISFM